MLGKIIAVMIILISSVRWIFASPPDIFNYPQNIKVDEEFILSASMSGLTKNGNYRLRIALSKPDSHVYFGSIEEQGVFLKYKNITMDEKGTWKGEIKGKVENSDPNYKEKELKVFELKLGRYTENGTSATWSETKTINLENPFPLTPTPSPTQKPQHTPVSTLPITQKTPEPTLIFQTVPTPKESNIVDDENFDLKNILTTESSKISETPRPSSTPDVKPRSKAKFYFFVGAFFCCLASVLAFIKRKKDN